MCGSQSWTWKWVITGILSHCGIIVPKCSLGSWTPPPCYSSRSMADLKRAKMWSHHTIGVRGQLELAGLKLLVDLRTGTQGLPPFIYGLWWVVFWGCPSSLNILKCSSLGDQLQVPQKTLAIWGCKGHAPIRVNSGHWNWRFRLPFLQFLNLFFFHHFSTLCHTHKKICLRVQWILLEVYRRVLYFSVILWG